MLQETLFDQSSPSNLSDPLALTEGIMLTQLAIGLSVIAVALIGIGMLSGRMNLRGSVRTFIGIFVLLGSPIIAASLIGVTSGLEQQVAQPPSEPRGSERQLNATPVDPNAGASLRRN